MLNMTETCHKSCSVSVEFLQIGAIISLSFTVYCEYIYGPTQFDTFEQKASAKLMLCANDSRLTC